MKRTADGRSAPLVPKTLGARVRDLARQLHIGDVMEDEDATGPEVAKLSGHFLRGHAGSIAYELAINHSANWESTEGIDRARHTMASFFKNYLRGVVPRLVMAFNALKGYKRVLRLEEALRL